MEGPFEFVELDDTTGEAGMATAEYAMGTLTSTGIAGILWWIIKQDWFRQGFVKIFKGIFSF